MCFVATGTTLALSATTDVGRITSMDGFEEEITAIPDDDLSTVGHNQYCPGGKIDHTPIAINVVFNPDTVRTLGVVETGTFTFPPQAGQTNGATLAGTGFLRKRGVGSLENNQRVEGAYEWKFDGKTGAGLDGRFVMDIQITPHLGRQERQGTFVEVDLGQDQVLVDGVRVGYVGRGGGDSLLMIVSVPESVVALIEEKLNQRDFNATQQVNAKRKVVSPPAIEPIEDDLEEEQYE